MPFMQTKQNARNMRTPSSIPKYTYPLLPTWKERALTGLHNQIFPKSTQLENWEERRKQEPVSVD